jgi:hypothetical protein
MEEGPMPEEDLVFECKTVYRVRSRKVQAGKLGLLKGSCSSFAFFIGVRRGVSKEVEDCRKQIALQGIKG